MFHTVTGAESEETLRQYNEHNKAVMVLRALSNDGLSSVLAHIDGPVSVE